MTDQLVDKVHKKYPGLQVEVLDEERLNLLAEKSSVRGPDAVTIWVAHAMESNMPFVEGDPKGIRLGPFDSAARANNIKYNVARAVAYLAQKYEGKDWGTLRNSRGRRIGPVRSQVIQENGKFWLYLLRIRP